MFDYAARRARLTERMEEQGVDALFLAPSADLEYLTGVERQIPNFGEASYAHGWVTGAFFRPDADPVFLFPRMFAAFDLREEPEGEVVVVSETDDGTAIFERVARGLGADRRRRRPRLGGDGAPPRPRRRLRRASAPARASSTSCAASRRTRSWQRWGARSSPSSRRWPP